MDRATSPQLEGYLLRSLAATSFVVLLPALVVTALQVEGHVGSSLLALLLGASLSVAFATIGRRLWARRPRDVVYSDLMLWGYVRRLRTERRLAEAKGLLGLDGEAAEPADHVTGQVAVHALESLGAALEARDSYTHGHTQRVARYSHMIAKAMGLPAEQVAKVRTAAAVHDVGKISTPREVMNKPGPLTAEEYEEMKRHSVVGAAMAARINDQDITAMVRHHHEQLDGSGYPDGLQGESIPLGARIIAVADTFDAITSARPYRPAQHHRRAMQILRRESGKQLDARAVEAFLGYYSGRRAVAWWSVFAAAPQKVAAGVGSLMHTTGAASISQGMAAIGAAAAIAGGAADVTRKHERDSHRAARSAAAHVQTAAYPAPSGGAPLTEVPRDSLPVTLTPVSPTPRTGAGKGTGSGRHGEAKPGAAAPAATEAEKGKSGGGTSPGQAKKAPENTLAEPAKSGKGNDGAPPGQSKPAEPDPAPAPAPTTDPAPAPTGPGKGNGGVPPGQAKPKK